MYQSGDKYDLYECIFSFLPQNKMNYLNDLQTQIKVSQNKKKEQQRKEKEEIGVKDTERRDLKERLQNLRDKKLHQLRWV